MLSSICSIYIRICITYRKAGRRGAVIFQIGVQLSSCLSPGVRLTMTGNGDVNNEANTVRTTAECSSEEHTRVPRIYNPRCVDVEGLIIL
jgi:hypothetical protein